eukprot:6190962-Amphidinium_carterae.1
MVFSDFVCLGNARFSETCDSSASKPELGKQRNAARLRMLDMMVPPSHTAMRSDALTEQALCYL